MKKWTSKRLIGLTVALLVAVGGFGIVTSEIGTLLLSRLSIDLGKVFYHPYFHIGKAGITLALLLKVVVFVLILTFISHQVRRFMQSEVLVRTSMDAGQQFATARITGYLIFVVGMMVGLQSIGVDLSSLGGLGRALGETMAVTFVIGNTHAISKSLFLPGNTISSTLANEFAEATTKTYTSALIALGLILFLITFIVLAIAKLLLLRLAAREGGKT